MKSYKSNLDKRFILTLGKVYLSHKSIGQLLSEQKLIELSGGNLIDDKKNMDTIARIVYTYDYLIKNNIISVIDNGHSSSSVPIFSLALDEEMDRYEYDIYRWFRISLQSTLSSIWNNKIKLESSYHAFVLNDYKTNDEIQKYWFIFGRKFEKNLWLPILTSVLTAILTSLLPLLLNYNNKYHKENIKDSSVEIYYLK